MRPLDCSSPKPGETDDSRKPVHLTLLVDNKAGTGLEPEHGLSIWIQALGRHVLFDTGQGPALAGNASRLKKDLSHTQSLILSHGHYDHGGGIAMALASAPEAEIYLHPEALVPKYSLHPSRPPRYVGLPKSALAPLESLPPGRIIRVEQPVKLNPCSGLTGPIPRRTSFEDTGGPFFLDEAGHARDWIRDDLAMWIHTSRGLVVLMGCAHAGVINTLWYVLNITGEHKLHAVIGGMHLAGAQSPRLEKTLEALGELGPELIVPCHCTGERAVKMLKKRLPGKVMEGFSGLVLEF